MGNTSDTSRFSASDKTRARRMFEIDGLSKAEIARTFQVNVNTIKKWCTDYKWRDRGSLGREIAETEEKSMIDEAAKAGVTRGRVLAEIAALGFSDIRQLYDVVDGKVFLKPLDSLPPAVTRTIRKLKQKTTRRISQDGDSEEDTTLDIEMYGKEGSLRMMGEELGMFKTPLEKKIEEIGVLGFFRAEAAKRRAKPA